jgi:uncharacterized protein (DUF4415 family)
MKKQAVSKRVDDENPEWSQADIAKAVRFAGLPEEVRKTLSTRTRGPQIALKKVPISIRLSPDVLERLRATGSGWQARADEALRAWLDQQGARGKKRRAAK